MVEGVDWRWTETLTAFYSSFLLLLFLDIYIFMYMYMYIKNHNPPTCINYISGCISSNLCTVCGWFLLCLFFIKYLINLNIVSFILFFFSFRLSLLLQQFTSFCPYKYCQLSLSPGPLLPVDIWFFFLFFFSSLFWVDLTCTTCRTFSCCVFARASQPIYVCMFISVFLQQKCMRLVSITGWSKICWWLLNGLLLFCLFGSVGCLFVIYFCHFCSWHKTFFSLSLFFTWYGM